MKIDGNGEPKSTLGVRTAVAVVLLALLAGTALRRNTVWETKLSLWSDVVLKSPRKARAHNNLGNCYMLLNRPFSAIEEYTIAVALNPNNIETYYNLGLNLEDVGIINQAAYYYGLFCSSAPKEYAEQKNRSCERARSLSPDLR